MCFGRQLRKREAICGVNKECKLPKPGDFPKLISIFIKINNVSHSK